MSPEPTTDPRRLLRCLACGQTTEVINTDLLRYTRQGWPKCCGHVMAYFTQAERPTEAGTRFAYKCPVCGHQWAMTFPPGADVPDGTNAQCERCRKKAPFG
jgi:DNA-directed RNA polymerase subunit RPC12/RpoP